MTNKTAIVFGLCLLAAIAYDAVMNGGNNLIFLGKKLLQLMEWMTFWR